MNLLKKFTWLEFCLWGGSVASISAAFLLMNDADYLTLAASLIRVTALIFCAKGYVLGQVLIVVFSVFYGIISLYFRYYGEMITYLGMTAPIAVMTMIEWMKHPFGNSAEVTVSRVTGKKIRVMLVLTVVVTTVFYYENTRKRQSDSQYSFCCNKFYCGIPHADAQFVLCARICGK